jgi:ribosomal protein S18 acetylase RimI-like enzyme
VADADAVADVYLRSRHELVTCAPLVHSDANVRTWLRRLVPDGRTTVATADHAVVALLVVSTDAHYGWIDQLYVLPAWIERGIGTRLLERARAELPAPIRLYAFQANRRARRFYERHGFRAVAFGDGSANEERCPDVLYEWRTDR